MSIHPEPEISGANVRQKGLTLLEVLAAFMIFSLVFTVLVGSSQNAVRTQGTSFRRLEADEIADSTMADLEVQLARRELPLIEEEEIDLDPYTVRITEAPFGSNDEVANSGVQVGPSAESLAGGSDVMAILAAEMPEIAPFFHQYEVEVEWQEGNRPMSVRRVTLGFDWPAASGVFSALSPTGTSGPDGGPDDGSTPGDESGGERGSDDTGEGGSRGSAGESEIERMKRMIREAEQRAGMR